MKITHIISRLDRAYGGPAAALIGMAHAQQAHGHSCQIVTYNAGAPDDPDLDLLSNAGVKLHTITPSSSLSELLDKVLAESDVVHVHGVWEKIQHLAIRQAAQAKIPVVLRPCGMLTEYSLNQKWLKKQLYLLWRLRQNLKLIELVQFTSELERQTSPLLAHLPACVIPIGITISPGESDQDHGGLRRRLGLNQESWPIVLFAGRLHEIKGLEFLLHAFAQVKEDAYLVLAGPDDGFQSRAKSLAETHRIVDRVIFTGMLSPEDVQLAHRAASVFVLPSYHENFGLAAAEALGSGTPVIVSDKVGIQQQIAGHDAGLVVQQDVDQLAGALNQLLSDPALRSEMGRNARQLAKDFFSWDAISQALIARYDQLIHGGVNSV